MVLSQEDVRNANGGSSGADLPQVAMLAPGGGCEGAQAMASGTLQVLVWRLPTAGLSLCYFVNSGSASREGLIRRGWANRGCCGSSFLVSHGGQRRCRRGRPVLPGGLASCAQGLLSVTLERGNEENIAR